CYRELRPWRPLLPVLVMRANSAIAAGARPRNAVDGGPGGASPTCRLCRILGGRAWTTVGSITPPGSRRGIMAPPSPQEAAFLFPLVFALLTTLMNIGVMAVAFGATIRFLRREYQIKHVGLGFWTDVAITAGVTLLAMVAHLVNVGIWALLYVACGEFAGLAPAFYHSAM